MIEDRYMAHIWVDLEHHFTFPCWTLFYAPKEGKMIFSTTNPSMKRVTVNLVFVTAIAIVDMKKDKYVGQWTPERGYLSEYMIENMWKRPKKD